MGFVPPASQPDYSKLVFMLNNSGVQKWNPAIYDILNQLIKAVQQSQTVLSDNIDTAAASAGGLTSVSVDPAGALSGNGTSGSPLAVKVDGTTISISGSDQLVSLVSGLSHIQTSDFAGNIPTGTTVSGVIPAQGTNIVAVPLIAVAQVKYTAYTTGRSLSIRYNGNVTDEILLPNVISGGGVPSTGRWVYGLATGPFNRAAGDIENKPVDIVFSGANSAFTLGDQLYVDLWYVTFVSNI